MNEKDLWNFFMLTGGIDSYLAYKSVKDLSSVEFAKEESIDGEGNGNNNQNG